MGRVCCKEYIYIWQGKHQNKVELLFFAPSSSYYKWTWTGSRHTHTQSQWHTFSISPRKCCKYCWSPFITTQKTQRPAKTLPWSEVISKLLHCYDSACTLLVNFAPLAVNLINFLSSRKQQKSVSCLRSASVCVCLCVCVRILRWEFQWIVLSWSHPGSLR